MHLKWLSHGQLMSRPMRSELIILQQSFLIFQDDAKQGESQVHRWMSEKENTPIRFSVT